MQKLLRNIQLNFGDGEKKLTVGNLILQKNYFHISETERFNERGCLLTKTHSYLTTQLDCTGVTDRLFLCFDEELNIIGIKYYKNHQDAPFSFSTTAAYLFVIPDSKDLPIENTISLDVLDSPS